MFLILYRHYHCLEGLVRGKNRRRLRVGCCNIICFFTSALGFIYAFDYTDVQVQVLNAVIVHSTWPLQTKVRIFNSTQIIGHSEGEEFARDWNVITVSRHSKLEQRHITMIYPLLVHSRRRTTIQIFKARSQLWHHQVSTVLGDLVHIAYRNDETKRWSFANYQ